MAAAADAAAERRLVTLPSRDELDPAVVLASVADLDDPHLGEQIDVAWFALARAQDAEMRALHA